MSTFNVPTREQVTNDNQVIFDNLEKAVGFVPNLFATFAYSENALASYLALSNAKTSLTAKEKEVINLAVSQVNDCEYCLAAHTAIGKMNGFNDDQIVEIRKGTASFDAKLDALAKFTRDTVIQRGKPGSDSVSALLEAGYTKENLVDALLVIGDKTITNYLHGITKIPVDFPAAPQLTESLV